MKDFFFGSTPGRVLSTAFAAALLGAGSYALGGSIVLVGIAFPLAIALGVMGCGLSIPEHGKQAVFAVVLLPIALFLLGLGMGVARSEGRTAWGVGFVALGIGALAIAVTPQPTAEVDPVVARERAR
jgi:hypothetical protein